MLEKHGIGFTDVCTVNAKMVDWHDKDSNLNQAALYDSVDGLTQMLVLSGKGIEGKRVVVTIPTGFADAINKVTSK